MTSARPEDVDKESRRNKEGFLIGGDVIVGYRESSDEEACDYMVQ
jgi:hypothetical protein